MTLNFRGRKVQVTDYNIDGEITDAIAAHWDDNAEDLTDSELDALNEQFAQEIYDHCFQIQVGKAEAMRDAMEDR